MAAAAGGGRVWQGLAGGWGCPRLPPLALLIPQLFINCISLLLLLPDFLPSTFVSVFAFSSLSLSLPWFLPVFFPSEVCPSHLLPLILTTLFLVASHSLSFLVLPFSRVKRRDGGQEGK